MKVLVGGREREEHGVDAEQPFEEFAHRQRRAHADTKWLLSVDLLEHPFGGHKARMVRRDPVRQRAMPLAADGEADAAREVGFEMPHDKRAHPVRVLIGNEAAADLRTRFVRRDRLAALPLVATPHAVYFKGRAYPLPLERAVAAFAEWHRR